ncbi:MAG TPA: molybdopterin cofactor-binding domain-containing protein [Pseudolabrys sp.]|nr:molybdopterin cofactor-binding domain-containing protein [Pseudolabrys sp.]
MNMRPDFGATDPSAFSRRSFLKGSSGLVIAFSLFGGNAARALAKTGAQTIGTASAPPPADKLYAWLAVNPDNTVTLFTGKVEVGNGTETALAQIAAEELDFPIDKLDVVMGTTSKTVDQGPTYGSRTVRYAGPQIRHAAAAGREALLKLAAKHFNVPVHSLEAKGGHIAVVGAADKTISYGELVAGKQLDVHLDVSGKKFKMKVAPDAPVKKASAYTVVGKPVKRKDLPSKFTGQFTYVQDVKVDGMLHGRVVRPYGVKSKLLSVDESGLKDIPGFVQVVRKENFLGVVAETEWAAIVASRKLGSRLHLKGPKAYQAKWSDWEGLPEQDKIWSVVREAPGPNQSVAAKGSAAMALASAKRTLKASYKTPFQMHGAIGPSCAVADVRKDSAIFWVGTQMPHESRGHMAKLLGMDPERIELRWFEASGAYGRNGLEHAIADAALMSQAVGKPVRVQWMRWDEHGWEPKGPAIAQELAGGIDEHGNVIAWQHHMWMPTWLDDHLIAAELIGRPDIGHTGNGLPSVTYAYTFDNADVANHGDGRIGLLTSWLRAPGQFETTFAMESFIDELAAATGQDPLAFRLKHVSDPRAIAVLRAAADAYGWKARPSPAKSQNGGKLAHGRGIAWVNRDDSRVATILDVTVDRDSGQIKVGRVVVAHDCGLVINPDGVKNQIEGNVIQSISRTLKEEVTFDHSHVTSRDWVGYPILRFSEIPDRIDTVIVNNMPEYPSHGAGEPSTCPTAAAIGNAVFDATGKRLRQTPFRPDRVKAALSS